MWKKIKLQHGATLLELILFMSIAMLLFGYVTFNMVNFQQKTSITASIDTLISDLRSQQAKAMTGKSDSGAGSSYGVYFQSDRYILFTGSSYSGTSSTNFTVMLDPNIIFTNITFPSSTIVFLQQSGELSGFINGNNTITVQSSQGTEKKTLTINRYGALTNTN